MEWTGPAEDGSRTSGREYFPAKLRSKISKLKFSNSKLSFRQFLLPAADAYSLKKSLFYISKNVAGRQGMEQRLCLGSALICPFGKLGFALEYSFPPPQWGFSVSAWY